MFYQLSHFGKSDYFKKEYGENLCYSLHLHQSFELILIEEGSMEVSIDGTVYSLNKNEAVLIFPNQIHSLNSVTSKHVLFLFSPQFIQAYWTEKNDSVPENNKIFLDDYTICALSALSEQSSKFEIKGVLYNVCASFDKSASYIKISPDKQTLIFKILSYVENNFKEDCSLSTLAKSVGYNSEYISRFFKEKMSISYNQYLNIRRLNHATYLLTNTDQTMLSCAIESGYTSLRTFNRNFKSYYEITPQEYRNNGRTIVPSKLEPQ